MLDTLKIKLLPSEEQANDLLATVKQYNLSCDYISKVAVDNKTYSKFRLQKLCYREVRELFNLSSQMTVRAIGNVSERAKNDLSVHCFDDYGPMVLDNKLLSFKGLEEASILTVSGRVLMPMIIGGYYEGLMFGDRVKGQGDLIIKDDEFYILLAVKRQEKPILHIKEIY